MISGPSSSVDLGAPGKKSELAGRTLDPALVGTIERHRARNAYEARTDLVRDLYGGNESSGHPFYSVYFFGLLVSAITAWAAMFELDEITRGSGIVVPSGKVQIIQSLDGGIVDRIHVIEGQEVQEGEPLVQINDVRIESNVAEVQAKLDSLTAASIRLRAEVDGGDPVFPHALRSRSPKMVDTEAATFRARRRALDSSLAVHRDQIRIAESELALTEPLAARGLVSELDVLKIKRALTDNRTRMAEIVGRYRAESTAELARTEAELKVQSAGLMGRKDSLKRTTIRAPKRGIVKNIRVSTVGGVLQSGQEIMEIVPVDDYLIVEVRINPEDIAFIRPGLQATVKITAYDSTVYGALKGQIVTLSPDTLRDEVQRDRWYYKGLVRTDEQYLSALNGRRMELIAGMQAEIDIKTGSKTVLDYLLKPILKSREALRER